MECCVGTKDMLVKEQIISDLKVKNIKFHNISAKPLIVFGLNHFFL